jgi:hypothetical protein
MSPRSTAPALRSCSPSSTTAVSSNVRSGDAGLYHDGVSPFVMTYIDPIWFLDPSRVNWCLLAPHTASTGSHDQYHSFRDRVFPSPRKLTVTMVNSHVVLSHIKYIILVIWRSVIGSAKQQSVVGLVVCYHLPNVGSEEGGDHGCKYSQNGQFET